VNVLIVPGIGGSGPDHWQSLWEQPPDRRCTRFRPASWDEPDAADWVDALDASLKSLGPDTVVVTHSLGGPTAAHLLSHRATPCRAAVLVAPPDVNHPDFPDAASTFVDLPTGPAAVPVLVVSSSDDIWCSPEESRRLASRWGAQNVEVGPYGHINAESGLGEWLWGWYLLRGFLAENAPKR
jgi:predicted alpha/beta hydrolase family esterase